MPLSVERPRGCPGVGRQRSLWGMTYREVPGLCCQLGWTLEMKVGVSMPAHRRQGDGLRPRTGWWASTEAVQTLHYFSLLQNEYSVCSLWMEEDRSGHKAARED